MGNLVQQMINALIQIALFALLPFVWWLIGARRKSSFLEWLGLKPLKDAGSRKIWLWILLGSLFFLLLSFLLLYTTVKGLKTATSNFSGLGFKALPAVLIYGLFQTSLPEELLFRGFLLKRLASRLSFVVANTIQAALFGQFSIHGRLKYKDHVEKYLSSLPDQFSYEELENIARKEGEENTTNNDLGVENHFYNTKLKKDWKKWEGSQKNFNFLQSTEYNDLQLVLDQFAKSKVNVLFVFQPVNQKWMNYTGLSEEMYQHSIEKIRYQLESQGFTNIADFSKNGGDPYFVKDTIHIGWLGWLAFDKVVNPFLSNPTTAPNYQMNDRFFSQDWANYDGNIKDFQ